jgi:ABC-2 type transport system permease protein
VKVMWERIIVILRKEFRQTLREPRMRLLLIMPPLLQLVIFGYAVNLDVDNVRMAWMDLDRTPESRNLLAAFEGSGRFQVVAIPEHDSDVQVLMDRGKVEAVVRVQPGFARDIQRGNATTVQVLVEGTNSNTASLVSSYANQIISTYSAQALQQQMQLKKMARSQAPVNLSAPDLAARSRVWFNPDLKSRNYFVPGVVANIIMIVTLMLTSLAIVREKEIGTMEQLMVTPMRPIELMIGKMLPFGLVGLFDVILVTTAALLLFHIPLRGNPLLLLLGASLFLLTSLGAGLFISTISRTQQQAMMTSFLFSMPCFMLSGFSFPIQNMPVAIQYLTYLNPLRYFMEIVRGVFLKGTGVTVLWPQMAALAVYGTTVMALSAARFQKRLD